MSLRHPAAIVSLCVLFTSPIVAQQNGSGIAHRVAALEAKLAVLEQQVSGALDPQALVGTWTGSRFHDPGFSFNEPGNISEFAGDSVTFRADGTGTSTFNNLETEYLVAGRSVLFGKYLLQDATIAGDVLTFSMSSRPVFFTMPGSPAVTLPASSVGQPVLFVLRRQP